MAAVRLISYKKTSSLLVGEETFRIGSKRLYKNQLVDLQISEIGFQPAKLAGNWPGFRYLIDFMVVVFTQLLTLYSHH